MNKITKKLFKYFTVLLAFFSITAFIGFLGVFRYFNYQHLENELKERAMVIKNQLEEFMDMTNSHGYGQGQGRGAYLRFVDDIAMADVYILDADGNPFTYGRHGEIGNVPSDDIREFASRIFSSGNYIHICNKAEDGSKIFYIGVPVVKQEQVVLAVIIRDTARLHQESFLLAISILGICMLLTLFLSGLLSMFLSRRFILPIQQIAFSMKELTRGNYHVTTNVHDQTELGELAAETDQLAQTLEKARQENSNLEQMQKDYISNISHELRTPVTVIRSSLEAVCDGVVTGEKVMEYQHQMLAECISLQRLVNDMLELSRLQNEDFPIEKENMDLQMALEDAVRAVRVLAKDKSIHIHFEKEHEGYFIEGDYGRLKQMFIAALDNAIKYSPTNTEVYVNAKKQTDSFVISIRDHGYGIPNEELEHIFDKFYRSRQNHEKGSGLGLAIIKRIGERHNINIQIKSIYGDGTEIIFSAKL